MTADLVLCEHLPDKWLLVEISTFQVVVTFGLDLDMDGWRKEQASTSCGVGERVDCPPR